MIKVDGKWFVDKWCARNVRKVKDCRECLHYEECAKLDRSVSPRAQERAEIKNIAKTFEADFEELVERLNKK